VAFRKAVPAWRKDRFLSADIETARGFLSSDAIGEADRSLK
jgi:hypothetical protein